MKLSRNLIIVIAAVIVIVVIAASVMLASPKSNNGGTTPPDTNPVSITSSFTFSPGELTIHVGQNVTWTNDASVTHTVTSDSSSLESFSSGPMTHGQTFTHQFNAIGDFNYHCSIHTTMTGTIHVIA
jgi:plastocyanin